MLPLILSNKIALFWCEKWYETSELFVTTFFYYTPFFNDLSPLLKPIEIILPKLSRPGSSSLSMPRSGAVRTRLGFWTTLPIQSHTSLVFLPYRQSSNAALYSALGECIWSPSYCVLNISNLNFWNNIPFSKWWGLGNCFEITLFRKWLSLNLLLWSWYPRKIWMAAKYRNIFHLGNDSR